VKKKGQIVTLMKKPGKPIGLKPSQTMDGYLKTKD
jgi:hypothetical protein